LPWRLAYPFFGGVYLPAKTPHEIVERLHGEIAKALAAPAVLERLATLGVEPMPFSQAQFAVFVRDDVAANIALVKTGKIPTQ
jgi:tripartite-type tricarboxylate transporter receptor subunit TctC